MALSPDDTAPPHKRHGSGPPAHVMTAYVVEPGGPCNRYRWDTDTGTPILTAVLHPPNARGADLARVPLLAPALRQRPAVDEEAHRRRASWIAPLVDDFAEQLLAGLGPSLLVLVLTTVPNPPGTQLRVRFLGALRLAPPTATNPILPANNSDSLDDLAAWIALGVPAADPTLAQVEHVSDLPDDLHLRLDHALATLAAPPLAGALQQPDIWRTADQLVTAYRQARAGWRLSARASDHAAREGPSERLFTSASSSEWSEAFRQRLAREVSSPPPEPASGEWRESTPISAAELRARGVAVFGEAEQLVRWVPTRFARYLGDMLMPDEHVLFFAACPPLTLRGWSGRADEAFVQTEGASERQSGRQPVTRRLSHAFDHLRPRHLQAGLLLITDRQALLLRDFAAPDATLVQWGYVAQSWPLGRLVAVRALPPDMRLDAGALDTWPLSVLDRLSGTVPFDEATAPSHFTRLLLGLEGAGGVQLAGAVFPPDMRPVLARAADRLQAFLPWPGAAGAGDRRVRLVPTIEPWRPTEREAAELASLGGMVAPALASALDTATAGALRPGEIILAHARTPRLSEAEPAEAALLTLTPERLLLATVPVSSGIPRTGGGISASARTLPLGSITAVTLQQSLLGCALRVAFPAHTPTQMRQLAIGFPSPLIVPFRALYSRLRQLVGAAPIRAGDGGERPA